MNPANQSCRTFSCEPAVFPTLQNKSTESQFISISAAGKDLFFRQSVTGKAGIAFPDTTVITVISAVIRKKQVTFPGCVDRRKSPYTEQHQHEFAAPTLHWQPSVPL